ncbi:diadenosine tetraphosphate (Ap4A) HIT family hydrolase [Allocatelliglobosispora scoriae]|uniref:Diadenosine tetraphosphate (Ap4A) HIT family hydrolase n=1 Tax=Allocatelliglobosispora scoriae TaxID=643052 RepID=A0A841BRL4_9ACTN|nr:diadenosine tetraphosphate (Ap4A) HIT family hydrolase [Allocatelliglobosispora scoriae]
MGRHHSSPLETVVDWREDRLAAARTGDNPMLMAKMRSGFAVFGDTQHLPGYCVLISDVDDADHLTDLSREQRLEFLTDLSLLGEVVFNVCSGQDPAFLRINYEVLGNSYHHLHGHVHARYYWESGEFRGVPVWRYPDSDRFAPEHDATSSPAADKHEALRDAITAELHRVITTAY